MKRKENISVNRILSGSKNSEIDIFSPPSFSNIFYPYIIDSANEYFVGLTIDILNKNETKDQLYFNEKIVNSQRDRQYFPSDKDKWGFIETCNPNNTSLNISNAFCFCGQKIRFYISTKDQDVGYFDNQFVYCKTQLVISCINIVTAEETILKTFSQFELEEDDENRYFDWEVPSCTQNLSSEYGLFGLFAIKLDVSRLFYSDAELTKKINKNYPYKNQSVLQLLVYSGPSEALNVNSSVQWLKDKGFSIDDLLETIFDHTIISDLEDSNLLLTTDQKRAIVADQIAFLFIAQHPVITADYYPSKIIGLGINQNVRSEIIIKRIQTYSRQYPEIISLVQNRLFSILATYKKYNFLNDIESCFDSYSQSIQKLRDPVKILFIDESGNLNPDYGTDGVLLNPYVLNTTESDMPLDVILETTEEITFSKGEVSIDNINITNIDGTPLSSNSKYAKVSFSIVNGSDNISRIRYSLWTMNNLDQFFYVDENGTSTYHIFNDFNILYDIDSLSESNSESDNNGEIIFVRIDIEDKDKFVRSFYGEKFLPDQYQEPGFTTIETFQRQDGSGMVDIYYDYFGTSEINNSKIDVYLSEDDGITWSEIDSSKLIGDYGIAIMPGRNHIVWEPIKVDENFETNDYGDYVLLKLTLYDIDGRDNKGKDSNISVIRFDKPIVALRKLTREEESEMWISSSSSLTSESSSSSSTSSSNSSSSSSINADYYAYWIDPGLPNVTGYYYYSGVHDGYPYYTRKDGAYFLYHGWSDWIICESLIPGWDYFYKSGDIVGPYEGMDAWYGSVYVREAYGVTSSSS